MVVFVLISTIDEGISRVPDMLQPESDGVRYVVCWQRTSSSGSGCQEIGDGEFDDAMRILDARDDVVLVMIIGRGLCRSRNHAMRVAVGLQDNELEDAVFVIADDDERFRDDAFHVIRAAYERWPKLDIGLFRLRSSVDETYFKKYPGGLISWDYRPRYYYPCSLELTFRSRVYHAGLRFDERFGLGAEVLCAGEEEVFIIDARRKGLRVLIFPEDIAFTDPHTTGDNVLDSKVLRSKGAVYAYELGLFKAKLRALREAFGLSLRQRCWPRPILQELFYGIKYIRKWHQD